MSKIIENGIIVSPGIKIGKAFMFHGNRIFIPRYHIDESEVENELQRFEDAVEKTKQEIMEIQTQIAKGLSKDLADIFASHLMVLEDPVMVDKAKEEIQSDKKNVEWILNDITLNLISTLEKIDDDYMRERIIDITDINKRLIGNLRKVKSCALSEIDKEVIVFADDLTPSETAVMNKEFILAFVTDKGGKTSHTAIMAKALEIPAIVATKNSTSLVKNGDIVIVDAIHGKVIINPSEKEINEYKKYKTDFEELEAELSKLTTLPSLTLDSEEIFIYGNIEIPEEKRIIQNHGAQGIGLFRSEFLFLNKSLPDEEMQFNEYKKVIEFFKPFSVTIRTIDVGGDKIYAYNQTYKERNPFLGTRAIRFSLENPEIFKIQLRAILRASNFGNAKLMFPMITTVDEFIKAKSITKEVMEQLKKEKIPFDENIQIGIMIEVPSAVINGDILAKYVDFFSVGTNDLVQYTLAVDRINENIAYLYNPLDLSVLRLLQSIVKTANENKIDISICGEMAGEPQYTMVLLGLGFRHLSMSSSYMNQVKKIIRSVSIQDCANMVDDIMKLETTQDIENAVRWHCKNIFHDIFI